MAKSTKEIKRLPKGHKVIFCMTEDRIRELEEYKVSYKTIGPNRIEVEGFVSGDTQEKGLSCVALDNPMYCLCHLLEYQEHTKTDRWTRHRITKGYDDWWHKEGRYAANGINPSCPY